MHVLDLLEKGPMAEVTGQDNTPYELQISDGMKRTIYDTLRPWFQRTIDGGQDGLSAALDGMARLEFHYNPAGEDGALDRSFPFFIQAAERGYLSSMIALANLMGSGEQVLTEPERLAALIAIQRGADKNPQEGQAVLLALQSTRNAAQDNLDSPEP